MDVIISCGFGKVYAEGHNMISEPASTGVDAMATPAVQEPPHVQTTVLNVAAERHADLLKMLKDAADGHSLDVDFVHDLRVGTRRLGEVAAVLGALMDKPTSRMVDATLKGLRKSAGELRDLDVAGEHLTTGGRWRMPAVLRHVAEELVEEMHRRRAELEAKLRDSTRSAAVTGAMVLLARVIEDEAAAERVKASEATLAKEVKQRTARREKQVKKTFGNAAKMQTPEALHAARIAVKKLRYVMEVAESGGVSKTKKRPALLEAPAGTPRPAS